MKRRIFIGIATVLIVAMFAGCSGPAEKKLSFYNKGKALYEKGDYVKARLEFKNAVQIDPKYADAYYMLGMVAVKFQDYGTARASFDKVVELSPRHWDAQVQLGRFLVGAGKLDEAMGKADLVLKEDPKNEDALLLKGAVLFKRKDTESARRFLESVVGREVRKVDGYMFLASVYEQKGDRQNAEKVLLEGLRVNAKSSFLYLALADLYLKNKQTDEAAGIMQKVIALEPAVAEYRLALAGIYWGSGKEQQAAEALQALVSTAPKKEEPWIQAADFYISRNKTAEGEQQFKEGLRQNPKSFKLRFALSALYLATNRPDQAVSTLNECLGLERDSANPNILHTKNSLAEFYLSRQDTDKAGRYVDEVIRESPKNVDANYIKGTIQLRKQEGLQAVSSFRTVVNERPQFIPGYISLADAHAINKEPDLAFDTLQRALKIAPASRDVIRELGRIYSMQKDYKNAESQYRKILDANPKDIEVRADLGDLMLGEGDFRRAEAEYADITKAAPNSPLGYVKLSAGYMVQKKWDRAIEELEKVVRMRPDLWTPMNDLAYLLCDYGKGKKDLDKALTLARKADSLSPSSPSVFDTLGWIYYKRGELDQAVEWLGKAEAGNARNPVVNFHLGMALRQSGNPEKAKGYLRFALASKISFPGKDEAEKALAGSH